MMYPKTYFLVLLCVFFIPQIALAKTAFKVHEQHKYGFPTDSIELKSRPDPEAYTDVVGTKDQLEFTGEVAVKEGIVWIQVKKTAGSHLRWIQQSRTSFQIELKSHSVKLRQKDSARLKMAVVAYPKEFKRFSRDYKKRYESFIALKNPDFDERDNDKNEEKEDEDKEKQERVIFVETTSIKLSQDDILNIIGQPISFRPSKSIVYTEDAIFAHLDEVESRSQKSSKITRMVIFVVHGDNSYAYHDFSRDGKKYYADKVLIEDAQKLAEGCEDCEVLVFHQGAPKSTFSHWVAGQQKIKEQKYNRLFSAPNWQAEAELLQLHSVVANTHANPAQVHTALVYSGHEIPEITSVNYSTSTPAYAFGARIFRQGADRFLDEMNKHAKKGKRKKLFDHVILSNCLGGTPWILNEVFKVTDNILASFSPTGKMLIPLDLDGFDHPHHSIKKTLSFSCDRLKSFNKTHEIGLAVYGKKVKEFLKRQMSQLEILKSPYREGENYRWFHCHEDHKFRNLAKELLNPETEICYRAPKFRSKSVKPVNKKDVLGFACRAKK